MTQFVAGNRIELLTNGTEYFPALEAACDAATSDIYLETYIFEDDDTGRRIAAALARAARRGVATHVLIDGFGSQDLSDELIESMQEAGVQVLVYRPEISPWTLRRERLRRQHRKITVIDARIAFVGGINIIDDMHTPKHTPPRYDYAVKVAGPLLAQIYPVVTRLWKLVMWTQLKRRWPLRALAAPAATPCGNQHAAFVIRDNLRHRRDIEDAYLEAIGRAHSEILIASAYFFPGVGFRRALTEAAKRGVKVVLLLQGRVEYVLLHYASRALYGSFLGAGIQVFEYHRSFLHTKVAVIDGQWATVGSSNIDPMSLLLAREANVVIDDAGFARKLGQSLAAAMAGGAHRVERSGWKKQPLATRITTWLCYGLVRFLIGISAYGRVNEFR